MSNPIRNEQIDPEDAIGRQLVGILRKRIIENKTTPGQRFSEAEISASFGVSRQPVREAFIKLAEEGLVQVRPQRGTFVRRISLRAVEDARFIREAIEGDLVRILADKPHPALSEELRQQLKAQSELSLGQHTQLERTEFLRLDDLFHRTLADAAGRQDLWQLLDGMKSQMDRVRYLTTQTLDIRRLVDQHTAIVDAIEAGDASLAEFAMRQHLRTILQDLDIHRVRTPDLFEEAHLDLQDMPRVRLDQGE
ncbi:GntR family transcriptional regulator [Natronohydrobacter thiooxidans]|uniref:GntR family transcriptional regulator n=1 Tax=Natronohydrobacter thiooxidans TaxID=87172 RepID=UPI0008FF4D78|nr:GntR family transcriptional regulator [Natronohydrobacter thiooxidans]